MEKKILTVKESRELLAKLDKLGMLGGRRIKSEKPKEEVIVLPKQKAATKEEKKPVVKQTVKKKTIAQLTKKKNAVKSTKKGGKK